MTLPCAGATRPLVIAHGTNTPTNIDALIADMQSPLTKVDVSLCLDRQLLSAGCGGIQVWMPSRG